LHSDTAQADFEHSHVALCPLHAFEQAPQLLRSSVSLTHAVPHLTRGLVHTHALLMHVAPVGQAVPHAPQLLLSFVVSMQVVPLQSVSVSLHTQAPPWQDVPEGHFLPHTPQLFESIVTSVQAAPPPASAAPASPPHMITVSPLVLTQTQELLTQSAPEGHFFPHAAQLFGSLCALTHVGIPPSLVAHIVVAPKHPHVPLGSHPRPAVQLFPQPPQLAGS
jgi:hypothetical protein